MSDEQLDRIIELLEHGNAMTREALDANERRFAEHAERLKKQDEALEKITPESLFELFGLMAEVSLKIEDLSTQLKSFTAPSAKVPA